MKSFRDLPIRSKLTAVILLSSSAVVVVAGIAFTTNEYISFRRTFQQDVKTLAALTAENSSAAVVFEDPKDAQRTLDALRFDAKVSHAALYRAPGTLFATYPQEAPQHEFPQTPPALGTRFEAGALVVCVEVREKDRSVGVLFLRASLQMVYARLQSYIIITVAILLLAFVAAWVFSASLRRRIAQPIQHLADATRAVSQDNNYSLRVAKHSNDELGELTESFNRMLEKIQGSDRELRKNQERLHLALESSQIGTWDFDSASGRVYWDDFMGPLFGLPRGATVDSHDEFLQHVHPDDRDKLRLALAAALQDGADYNAEFRVIWPDQSVHYITARGRSHAESGRLVRMTGVCVDITQSKRSEDEIRRLNEELEQRVIARTAELAAANKELESFTYSVSHDLRAPLRHINGFAQMLEEEFGGTLSREAGRLLSRIRFGAQNMGQLVDDLLRLARIGRQELARRRASLDEVVQETVAELKSEYDGREIEWKIHPLPQVSCDSGLVKQIFANLLGNAVKYTRTRPVARIEVGAERRAGVDVIYVKDNGVGFDMKYAEKLFGVFQRLHRADEFEGTGVGLAIVHRIVSKHGGLIWAEAALDAGACFYFTLVETPASVVTPEREKAALS